jgi:curved DNA-binding protein CbpA
MVDTEPPSADLIAAWGDPETEQRPLHWKYSYLERRTMSFEIQRGLFGLDIVDYHAILGLPLNCDPNLVRQRYLKIAPLLHPDTCPAETPEGKEQARQLMSKLVNPAYATLANDQKRSEHEAVLRLLRDRLPQQKNKVRIQSEAARSLAQNPNFAQVYGQIVQKIAQDQYTDLNQVIDRIADVSELNLIYLARLTAAQGAKARTTSPMMARPSSSGSGNTAARAAAPAETPPAISTNPLVVRSYQRARECIEHGNLAQAMQELKDAIKGEGTNSACHALLGKIYLQQKQTTLAKVHLTRALAIDPNNAIAKAAKRDLDRILGTATSSTASKPTAKTITRNKPESGGGLFGGLFGGKKR